MAYYDGKVILYTGFYKQQAFAGYCHSLAVTIGVFERLGIEYDYCPIPGDFHLERAINDSLSAFARDDSATDWINIDSDHSWDPMAILKLLTNPEPIVCATYRITNEWGKYAGQFKQGPDGGYLGKLRGENSALLEAHRIPAGFMRLKKEVVTAFISAYPDDWFWLGGEENPRKVYQFFWNENQDHIFTGMDMALSDKLKHTGYQLYIDPELKVDHWGVVKHKGDLDGFLRGQAAIQEVKALAADLKKTKEVGDGLRRL